MLDTENYRRKLFAVLEKIKKDFDLVEVRGSDAASFLFAEKENRAVEIYQSENNVIVEFWKNEEQVSEMEVDSHNEAVNSANNWINNYEK